MNMLFTVKGDQEVKPTGKWAIKQEYYTWYVPAKGWFNVPIYEGAYRPILLLEIEGPENYWLPESALRILPGGYCENSIHE